MNTKKSKGSGNPVDNFLNVSYGFHFYHRTESDAKRLLLFTSLLCKQNLHVIYGTRTRTESVIYGARTGRVTYKNVSLLVRKEGLIFKKILQKTVKNSDIKKMSEKVKNLLEQTDTHQ